MIGEDMEDSGWMYDDFEALPEVVQGRMMGPEHGNIQLILNVAPALLHEQMFNGDGNCLWRGSAYSDVIVCQHGFRLYKTLYARVLGVDKN